MPKDYYSILGVSRDATDEEIKRAYRRLAHQYHPDKPTGDATKFKEINEAYQVLKDREKRKQYDQFGTTFEGQGAQGFPGFDFSKFSQDFKFDFDFGDIFSDFFGSRRRHTPPRERRGRDIEMDLSLSFKEAVFGTEKELKLYKNISCTHCGGSGAEPGTKIIECERCRGRGEIETSRQTILGSFTQISSCPECQGEGRRPEKKCSQCRGEGVSRKYKTLKVKIPAGIKDGQTLTLENEGEAGRRGGPNGDLYLHITVKPDPLFQRRGNDILSTHQITFSQAALGAEIFTQTIDGKVKVKIPQGIQSGTTIKLENKGVPFLNGVGRGDHLLKIEVVTPQKLTPKMRKLFEELAQEESKSANKKWFRW